MAISLAILNPASLSDLPIVMELSEHAVDAASFGFHEALTLLPGWTGVLITSQSNTALCHYSFRRFIKDCAHFTALRTKSRHLQIGGQDIGKGPLRTRSFAASTSRERFPTSRTNLIGDVWGVASRDREGQNDSFQKDGTTLHEPYALKASTRAPSAIPEYQEPDISKVHASLTTRWVIRW